MIVSKHVVFISLLLSLKIAFSHGMDKPGPHGGEIRMPGAFHTEVIQLSPGKWKIYLLDENLTKPQVKNSSVSGTVEMGKEKVELSCKEETDYFLCQASLDALHGNPNKLKLKAKRKSSAIGYTSYQLPLAF